jgi:beta-lysine N6-acetyltransferase
MDGKDKVINYHGSIIQHGSYNDRIYLMKLDPMTDDNYPFQLINL